MAQEMNLENVFEKRRRMFCKTFYQLFDDFLSKIQDHLYIRSPQVTYGYIQVS